MDQAVHSSSGGSGHDKHYFEINLVIMKKKKKAQPKGVPPLLLNFSSTGV